LALEAVNEPQLARVLADGRVGRRIEATIGGFSGESAEQRRFNSSPRRIAKAGIAVRNLSNAGVTQPGLRRLPADAKQSRDRHRRNVRVADTGKRRFRVAIVDDLAFMAEILIPIAAIPSAADRRSGAISRIIFNRVEGGQ
jgi:hypothetical protein